MNWEQRAAAVTQYARALLSVNVGLATAIDSHLHLSVDPEAEPEAWWMMSTANALAWAELMAAAGALEDAGLVLLSVERGERGERAS